MKTLTVTDKVARFPPFTILKLSQEQASARAHNLKKVGADLYETQTRVEFKAGEKIGCDPAILSKALLAQLDLSPPASFQRKRTKSADKESAAPASPDSVAPGAPTGESAS